MAKSPFSCRCTVSNLKRDLQREVTRILITPHCSASAILVAGVPQVNLFLLSPKYSQPFQWQTYQPTSCLKSQLCCLHSLCLEVPLQFWAGDVYFGWVHVFAVHRKRTSSATGGICISAAMTTKKCILPGLWKKESAQEITMQIAYGCGLGTAFLSREMNATLSWEMSQNQQRKPS